MTLLRVKALLNVTSLIIIKGTLETAKNEGPQNFPKNKCRYALFKSSHKVELANTVKFAFVDWTPTTISPLRKGLLSIHKGQVVIPEIMMISPFIHSFIY